MPANPQDAMQRCTEPAPGGILTYDAMPEMLNRSAVWDSAIAEYDRTGRMSEAFVHVEIRLDTAGVPVCFGLREIVGDSTVAPVAARASMRSRWTPAKNAGEVVPSWIILGFALCKEDAQYFDQHMGRCRSGVPDGMWNEPTKDGSAASNDTPRVILFAGLVLAIAVIAALWFRGRTQYRR